MNSQPQSLFIGITGASGALYAVRLVTVLSAAGCDLTLSVTDAGVSVLRHELGLEEGDRRSVTDAFLERSRASARVYLPSDLEAPPASGSALPDAVVICPCSLSTVAHIALGTTRTLVHRVGDVALKERRRLVLVPREMPLSEIHLQRLLEVRRAGADVVPPMPAFYARPESIADLVDFVVGKILNVLGFEQQLFPPWGADAP
jgi:flavin prenyltransferase